MKNMNMLSCLIIKNSDYFLVIKVALGYFEVSICLTN